RVLVHYLALEKEGLLQSAKKLLIGGRIFDGTQVVLGAGAHDELFFIPLAHGDGEPDKVTAVPEGAPRAIELGEDQKALIIVEMVSGIRTNTRPFEWFEPLAGDDTNLLIQDFDHEPEVLHGGDDGLDRPSTVGRLEHTRLGCAQFDLAFIREPDLFP